MVYKYFCQCAAGTEELCAKIVEKRLRDVRDLSPAGSTVAFSTAVPYSGLNLFCFNNIFRIIYTAPAEPDPAGLDAFLRAALKAPADWPACAGNPKAARTFRLMASCRGQLVSLPKKTKSAVEERLRRESGLRPDRSLPDCEFWAMARADGQGWLLKRLSRHKAYDKLLSPGELRPELAYMLCWLSNPGPGDVAADPFCGHGAIPLQRCRRFPYSRLLAFDADERMVDSTRQKLPRREGIEVRRQDALALSDALPPSSVDAFITDPPWGLYQDLGMPIEDFYRRALAEMERALKPRGRIVLLTAGKNELAAAMSSVPSLTQTARYDILVSGKKAAIFVLTKETLQQM